MATPTADITGFTEEQKRLFTQAAELGSGVQTTDGGVTKTIGAPKPITPDAMSGTESPYKTGIFGVEPPPDTSGLDKLISSLTTGSPEQTQAQEAQKSTLQTIQDTMAKLLGEGARKSELETEKGVFDKQKALNETIAQIRFNNASAFDATQTQEDRLAPTFAIQGTQAQIERQRAVKNYSLAAVAAVQQDNLALAQDQVQKALEAEFRPLERALEFQKLFLEQNRADLERADKKTADKLNIVLAERERILNQQKEDKNAIYNLIPSLSNAGSGVISSVIGAKTLDEALSIAAPYLAQKNNSIVKLDNGRTLLVDTQSGNVVADLGGAKQAPGGLPQTIGNAEYGTPDYYRSLFQGSVGGKQLTGEQTTPLTKAAIVLDQVGELAATLKTTNTDPILGILRDNNPYDVKARLIAAQLRSTVPNLARGVYGEVGVLTDTDIANYIQTLPNIRTPEQANNLVLAMTLGTIKNSYQNYLETYAASGRDVSGFVPKWQAMNSKIDSLINSAGANQSISSADDLYKKIVSGQSSEVTNQSSLTDRIGSWVNQLFLGF